ncbi:hypothetical protein TELCIR_07194 [Teladorsagia circumcincta]|uniref:Uncharacterized protein n=1 Tax=Teladorsagia circumcincta TaxID=45464 RepID=A0A2G9UMF9_TELCI|nr:hypothetical protein TELCIR_07194 [Teladorsagia circumcincta]
MQCAPQCQPSCQLACMAQAQTFMQPPAVVMCSQPAGQCACGSGYSQCMQGVCCLRKRHRQAKTVKAA